MKLMPIPGVRACACGHQFYTAHLGDCACPSCGQPMGFVTYWPHVCSSGHSANHGGDCPSCALVAKKESAAVMPAKEWKNRG